MWNPIQKRSVVRTKTGGENGIDLPRARCANAGRNSEGTDLKIAHRNGNVWVSTRTTSSYNP